MDHTGGDFHFVQESRASADAVKFKYDEEVSPITDKIEPKMGRLVIFSSGMENAHFPSHVTSGERYLLSFWFTCIHEKEKQYNLDGKYRRSYDTRTQGMKHAARVARRRASKRDESIAASLRTDL